MYGFLTFSKIILKNGNKLKLNLMRYQAARPLLTCNTKCVICLQKAIIMIFIFSNRSIKIGKIYRKRKTPR